MANDYFQNENLSSGLLPADYQVNLSDFALFLSVMKHKRAYECALSIILGEKDLELEEVKAEQVILNRAGKRAIRLDAWAKAKDSRQFDMEMQNDSASDSIPKRIRYYQGLLDTPILKAGKETKYRELPSTAIIFITQEDIFHKDLAKYTFTEQCEEIRGLHLEDGTKKIFLNMSSKNGSQELVSLLQYMKDTTLENPEILVKDDRIVELDQIVTEVKENEEWEAVQVNLIEFGMERGRTVGREEGIKEGREEGIKEGREEGIKEGKAEGIKEGKAEERADTVISFLEDYGEVPEHVRELIVSEKDADTLKKWVKLAARAASTEDFLDKISVNH